MSLCECPGAASPSARNGGFNHRNLLPHSSGGRSLRARGRRGHTPAAASRGSFLPLPAPRGGQPSLVFLGLRPHPSSPGPFCHLAFSLCVSVSESLLPVLQGPRHLGVGALCFSAHISVTSAKALFPKKATFEGAGIWATLSAHHPPFWMGPRMPSPLHVGGNGTPSPMWWWNAWPCRLPPSPHFGD